MGFAGQLSLGHSLYVGVGAYAAAALFFHYGIGPWAGRLARDRCCASRSARSIGFLAFRFGISGVYFALLTIAFAEFTRIGFDHLDWLGGPGGLFLKVAQRDQIDLLNFRGPPAMYYYAMLALAARRLRAVRLAAAQPRRLLLAGDPRERGGRAGARHQHLPLEDARGDDQLGDDRGGRRVLRLLLQQPLPRADLPHQPLDRDHPRADHRRHRHAVRPDPRRRAC